MQTCAEMFRFPSFPTISILFFFAIFWISHSPNSSQSQLGHHQPLSCPAKVNNRGHGGGSFSRWQPRTGRKALCCFPSLTTHAARANTYWLAVAGVNDTSVKQEQKLFPQQWINIQKVYFSLLVLLIRRRRRRFFYFAATCAFCGGSAHSDSSKHGNDVGCDGGPPLFHPRKRPRASLSKRRCQWVAAAESRRWNRPFSRIAASLIQGVGARPLAIGKAVISEPQIAFAAAKFEAFSLRRGHPNAFRWSSSDFWGCFFICAFMDFLFFFAKWWERKESLAEESSGQVGGKAGSL